MLKQQHIPHTDRTSHLKISRHMQDHSDRGELVRVHYQISSKLRGSQLVLGTSSDNFRSAVTLESARDSPVIEASLISFWGIFDIVCESRLTA